MTVVAIDGPAGAGKSTVGRAVARALGWTYVDTGAMYRAVALAALEVGANLDDGPSVGALAAHVDIELRADGIVLDGVDVSRRIRADDVTGAVSRVSAHPEVRDVLTARQRAIASVDDVVMEGRDIGASVAPAADVKIWLTASLPERARRRARQLGVADDPGSVDGLAESLSARDAADASRAASPLVRAPDAIVIDSTGMDVAEVVARVLDETRPHRDG